MTFFGIFSIRRILSKNIDFVEREVSWVNSPRKVL